MVAIEMESAMPELTQPPKDGHSFAGIDIVSDLARLEADVAILGIPYGTTYDTETPVNESAGSPAAIPAVPTTMPFGPRPRWVFGPSRPASCVAS